MMSIKEILVCFSIVLFASAIVLAQESSTQVANDSNSSESANNSSNGKPSGNPWFGHVRFPSRHKRSPEEHQGKGSKGRASCGFGSRKCISCNEAYRCLPGGGYVITKCSGFLRHCNHGSCSAIPSRNCRTTTLSSSSPIVGNNTTSAVSNGSTSSAVDSTTSSSNSNSSTSSSSAAAEETTSV